MKLRYRFGEVTANFTQEDQRHQERLSTLLTNKKGDYYTSGVNNELTKYQGLHFLDPETLEVYKVLDAIQVPETATKEVEYGGYYAKRKLKVESSDATATERTYLGPTGGLIYELTGYPGEITLDLDCRKKNDFDEWGRIYEIDEDNTTLHVTYTKYVGDEPQYTVHVGIRTLSGGSIEPLQEWTRKEYPYSKRRDSLYVWYVHRIARISPADSQKLLITAGKSRDEVNEQLTLLSGHQEELESFDEELHTELSRDPSLYQPVPQSVELGKRAASVALRHFVAKDLKTRSLNQGAYAGLPWFSDIWARDEIISLKAFMEEGEEDYVKERLFSYLKLIDEESGTLRRLNTEGSLSSPDAVLWLGRRLEDFIFYLDARERLFEQMSEDELAYAYKRLALAFNRMVRRYWDGEEELFYVNDGDSWMDTISVENPLDIQALLLSFIASMRVLADLIGRTGDVKKYHELELGLRSNIRSKYVRNGMHLYNEIKEDRQTSNCFLAYYLYPELFVDEDWKKIFDTALKELKTPWGGIRSLSKFHEAYRDRYTGENNESYHQGDSWYWINHLSAYVLQRLDSKYYQKTITGIILSSTKDLFEMGSMGYISEVSSAGEQEAAGCFAQLWSVATYLELIREIYGTDKR